VALADRMDGKLATLTNSIGVKAVRHARSWSIG
jgi:hypothetical protein